MSDLLIRLVIASAWGWGAWEIGRVGESNTRWIRRLLSAAMLFGALFWLAIAIFDPTPAQFVPFWTSFSRVSQVGTPIFIGLIARRRGEINGYH